MTIRADELAQDIPFESSLASLGGSKAYLGSMEVVEGLVRMAVKEWADHLSDGTATGQLATEIADRLAGILLGNDPEYEPMAGWNAPGGLDAFLASQLGIEGDDATNVLKFFWLEVLHHATRIVNYADEPGVLEEAWRWQVDALVEEHAGMLLGIAPDTFDILDASAEASAVDPGSVREGWVTINTGDDDEGGQRVYIDGAGKMQSGAFKGKTFDQAFGKGGKDKPAAGDAGSGDGRSSDAVPAGPAAKPAAAAAGDGAPDRALASMPKPPAASDPATMTKDDVKAAFKSTSHEKHRELHDAIVKARPDLAGEAAYQWQNNTPKKPKIAMVPPESALPGSPSANDEKTIGKEYQAYFKAALEGKYSAKDAKAFTELPAGHQTEFNAVTAFFRNGYEQMNAEPDHPASKKMQALLIRLPDAKPGTMYRSLGFQTDADKQAFVASLQKPYSQTRTFSSWTAADPTAAGADASTNLALAVADTHGDHQVILKYEKPQGMKDISFAHGDPQPGMEMVLQRGHQMQAKSVTKDANGRTVVTVGPPAAAAAKAPAAKKPKAAKAAPAVRKYETQFESPSVEKSFKKRFPNSDPGKLVGAPDGAKVKVTGAVALIAPGETSDDLYEGTEISVEHPGVKTMKRIVYYDHNGSLTVRNASIETTQPGLGRAILRDQIIESRKSGVSQITASAARHGANGKQFNGYYTWARYGYDAELTRMPGGGKKVRAAFPKAKMLSDVMATPEGRDWWKKNGTNFDGTFDLTPGSRSMKVFNAYLEAKGEGSV